MNELQALILGLIQGLTEYLPVSSSGHLEIGKMLLGLDPEQGGLTFDIVVHIATVLATIVILWKEIIWIVQGLFKFKWNDEAKYICIHFSHVSTFDPWVGKASWRRKWLPTPVFLPEKFHGEMNLVGSQRVRHE